MATHAGTDVIVLNDLAGPRIGAHYSPDELCVLALLGGRKFFRQLRADLGLRSGASLERRLDRLQKKLLLVKRTLRGRDAYWRDFYELTDRGRAYAGQIQVREMRGLFLELTTHQSRLRQ